MLEFLMVKSREDPASKNDCRLVLETAAHLFDAFKSKNPDIDMKRAYFYDDTDRKRFRDPKKLSHYCAYWQS